MRERANKDIREYAEKRQVYLYEIIEKLGYKSPNYSAVKFRYELSEEEKAEIFKLIDCIAEENEHKKSLASVGSTSKAGTI